MKLVHNAIEEISQEVLCQWLGPIGSAGTVGRVADTQMGEADTLEGVGTMCSAASEGGNISVCEADAAGSTGRLY